MSKDIEREAFERYARSKGRYIQISENTGKYVSMTLNEEWEAWQAAKAHEAEKLKGKVVVPVEMPDSFDDALYMYSNDISVVNSEGDGFIPMADLDHGKVWQLVLEAARGGNEEK
jgi:hypothetical protein